MRDDVEVKLRMPKSFHRRLKRDAKALGLTLNEMMLMRLEAATDIAPAIGEILDWVRAQP
jgi:hypothetical protein